VSYQAIFELGTFNGQADVALSDAAVEDLCEILTRSDVRIYQRNPNIPSLYGLYRAGQLRYFRPSNIATPVGPEPAPDRWRDVLTLIDNKFGDCKDLSCARVAELIVRHGINAKTFLLKGWGPDEDGRMTKRLYHVVVDYLDPKTGKMVREDISANMGMTTPW